MTSHHSIYFKNIRLDFDGRIDSIYYPFDKASKRHMEYVQQRSTFENMPLTQITADFDVVYGQWMKGQNKLRAANFEQNVQKEI